MLGLPQSPAPTVAFFRNSRKPKIHKATAGTIFGLLLLSAMLSVACGDALQGLPSATPLTITPAVTTMDSGAQLQFAAIVTGKVPATVTWLASSGLISNSGLFTAPSVQADTSVTITATSTADPKVKASVDIKVTSHSSVKVSVTPNADSIASGRALQFTASVTGTKDTAVKWSASAGSISGSGLFTAPSVTSNTLVSVTATSAANSAVKGRAAVTITPAGSAVNVSVAPSTSTVSSGSKLQFAASVTGISNTAVIWTASLGSIDNNGNYVAPSVTSVKTDSVKAVSMSDPTKYGTASVTVNPASTGASLQYWVSPTGSDSNDGSQAHPWSSIDKAISSFTLGANGTIIHVAAGSYTATFSCAVQSSVNMCVDRGGSTTARLVVQCDNQWSCKLTGGVMGINVVANYVDIVGFDVGNTASMSSGIFVPCQGSCGAGAASTTGNSVHILSNYVHDLAASVDTGYGPGCPWTGAIELSNQHGPYMTDSVVSGNLIARFGNWNLTNCNVTHGIYADTPNVSIYNNIIAQTPTSGIQLYSSECRASISNNVVMSAVVGIIVTPSTPTACSNPGLVTVDNNVIENSGKWHIQAGSWDGSSPDCTSSTPVLYSHNLTDGIAPDFNSAGLHSCDTVTATLHENPSTTFVNYQSDGTGNYQLNLNSAGINGGTMTCVSGGTSPCVPQNDFAGAPRPQGAAIDIGAYEVAQ